MNTEKAIEAFIDFCDDLYIAEEGISDWIRKKKENRQEKKRQQSISGYDTSALNAVASAVTSAMRSKTDDAVVQGKPTKITEDDKTVLMITVAVQGADEASLDYNKIISTAKADCGSDFHGKNISITVEDDQYGKYIAIKQYM